jgi:hypothetical protein
MNEQKRDQAQGNGETLAEVRAELLAGVYAALAHELRECSQERLQVDGFGAFRIRRPSSGEARIRFVPAQTEPDRDV